MDIASLCPLPVGVVRWASPLPSVTVVVKATYALTADGEAELAEAQEPLTLDRPSETEPDELEVACDFAPLKARADVLLIGGAHAETAVASIAGGFQVDDLARRFVAMAAAPATRIPLTKAYLREGSSADPTMADRPMIAVGPRSPWSEVRRGLASGISLDAYGAPTGPLPRGFDFGYFNAAPPEQQVGTLRANARIELYGLLAGAARRSVRLPLRRPLVFPVDGATLTPLGPEIAVRCDTLTIDTDRSLCTLTWRGLVDMEREAARSCLLVALPKAGETRSFKLFQGRLGQAVLTRAVEPQDLSAAAISSDAPCGAPREPFEPVPDADEAPTIPLRRASLGRLGTIQPVAAAGGAPGAAAPPAPVAGAVEARRPTPEPAERSDSNEPWGEEVQASNTVVLTDESWDDSEHTAAMPALPTGSGPSARLQALPFAAARGADSEGEPAPSRARLDALPFVRAADTESVAEPSPSRAGPDALPFVPEVGEETAVEEPSPSRARRVTLPFVPEVGEETAVEEPSSSRAPRVTLPFVPEMDFETPIEEPSPSRARLDALPFVPASGAAGVEQPSASRARTDTLPFVPASGPGSSAIQAEGVRPSVDAAHRAEDRLLPVEVYAAIRAELWERSSLPEEVLSRHGLDEIRWRMHERLHHEALANEARAGRCDRALALVAALAAARGWGAGYERGAAPTAGTLS